MAQFSMHSVVQWGLYCTVLYCQGPLQLREMYFYWEANTPLRTDMKEYNYFTQTQYAPKLILSKKSEYSAKLICVC